MNEMTFDIAAIGELLVDLAYCEGPGTAPDDRQISAGACGQTMDCRDTPVWPLLQAAPGGAPANFLAAAAAAGSRTAFIGKVGDDVFGRLLRDGLAGTGTDVTGLIIDPEVFTTLAFVTLDARGERAFSFARKPGADTCLRADEVMARRDIIDRARALHFGSLSLTDEPARSAAKEAVRCAKAAGKLITFDPNWREPLWKSAEEAREQMLWGISQADVVKISEEEVRLLWGVGPEEGLERLLRPGHEVSGAGAGSGGPGEAAGNIAAASGGAKLAWVTLGAEGCVFGNRTVRGRAVYTGALEAVDTTGAGDIFGGTAVSRLLQTGRPPEALSSEELCSVTSYAMAAASLSVTRRGGMSSVPAASETSAARANVSFSLTQMDT